MGPAEPSILAPAPRQARGRPGFSAAEATFHSAAFIWLVTCGVLWVAGYALARFAPVPRPDVENLRALFTPWAAALLLPEPQERRLYMALTAVAPLVILMGWGVVRRVMPGRAGVTSAAGDARLSDWTSAGAALFLCFGGVSLYVALTASIVTTVLQPVVTDPLLPVLGASLVLWWVLGCGLRFPWPSWHPWRHVAKAWRAVTLTLALTLALGAGIALRVYDYFSAAHAVPVHFNTALYSIPQTATGQRMLVDFITQYGCYAEFLKPWFALIGISVLRMTATLAVLQGLAVAGVVFTLARLLRSRLLLCLASASFAWLMHMWFNFAPLPPHAPIVLDGFDPYFQYYPIRLLFPALSLLAVWWYLRRPSPARAATTGALGGFAVWWNVDTGAVALASIVVLLAVEACAEWRKPVPGDRWQAVRRPLVAVGAAALAMLGFYLVLCVDARQVVDLSGVLHYQQLFYLSGFCMLPMPLTLSCWHLVVGLYLLGLTHGLKGTLAGRPLAVQRGIVLYLSVLGLGLFSYYQGRSHDNVLMLCDWPAVALALLLCDRLLAATRYGLLPRLYSAAVLPMLVLGMACTCCLWLSHEAIAATEVGLWQTHVRRISTPQSDAVGYIKRSVARGESSAVLSPYQTIYVAATGLRSVLSGPSMYEYLLLSDTKNLCEQLAARRAQHLFTEPVIYPESYGLLGEGFRAELHRSYRLVGSNPAGNLLHWVPRPDGTVGAFPKEFAARTRLSVSAPAVRHLVHFAEPNLLLTAEEEQVGSLPNHWGNVTFGSNFAIEMIVTPAAVEPLNACLISNHPGGGGDGLTVQRAPIGAADEYQCFFGDGLKYTLSPPFVLSPGGEHYLLISDEANEVSIYVDGRLSGQVRLAGPVSASITTLTLGDWVNCGRAFAGEIAEVKIHEHAVSADEAARTWQLMSAGSK